MSFKITINKKQNWVLVSGPDLESMYKNLNDVTEQMIQKHKNCGIDGFSFTYNPDTHMYVTLINFVSDID